MTTVIMKDPLREAVEAESGGKQTVLWTKSGFPSYMNIIPKFRCEDLHPTAFGSGTHPAFIVGGVEKNEIFIGTYQSVIQDGEAISLPGQSPATNVNFDEARAACLAAGPGFHLMTNWEWAAIALQCAANDQDVRGNTSLGNSHSHPKERGVGAEGSHMILTGSGPASWRHDGTPFGLADLVGNVWEWNDGLKLKSGQIIMPSDNNYHLQEDAWLKTGAFVDMADGCLTISSRVTSRDWDSECFNEVAMAANFEFPFALIQALVCPSGELKLPGRFFADNNEDFEALPIRGGYWDYDSRAGLAALFLGCGRSVSRSGIGFRPAFIA